MSENRRDNALLMFDGIAEKEMLMYEDYQLFMECQESAKIKAEYMILFAAGKFDNRLREEAKKNPYLALVSLEQMQFVK